MRRCFQCVKYFEGEDEEREYNEHLRSKEHSKNRNKKLAPDEESLVNKYN